MEDRYTLPEARYLLKVAKKDKNAVESITSFVVEQLQKQGLKCIVDGRHVVVSADTSTLLAQAEKMKWMKPLKNKHSQEVNNHVEKLKCIYSEKVAPFVISRAEEFEPSDGESLFTSAEYSLLLYHCLENIPYAANSIEKVVNGCVLKESKGFLSALQLCKPQILKRAYPLHEQKECNSLKSMLKWSILQLDVQCIRNYFGEEVGFYFGWMSFYQTFVCFPLVVGLMMFLLRQGGVRVNTDPYLLIFSIFMAFWGLLFIVVWQRQSNTYSFLWNTYKNSIANEERKEFYGVPSIDPVTHNSMTYYPSWKRRLRYILSLAIILPFLCLGVVIMTLSLNLNGYVKDTKSFIYVETLAKYAKPGEVFSGDVYFLWLVPTGLHCIFVRFVNYWYSRAARWCTDKENHRTVQSWRNSLVVKRVFFECFDCFLPLFYIAFYQLDVVTLQAEIFGLFMWDEFRRVAVETVFPITKQCLFGQVNKSLGRASNIPDTNMVKYDDFDDYLEMVVQFGYIMLFASAFPLGAAVTFLFLHVEVRSDLFKLLTAYRRPFPRRVKDIGVWFEVMKFMVVLGVLTNCFIVGFSSEQLMQFWPSFYTKDPITGDHVIALGSGRFVVGTVFVLEHIVLLVGLGFYHAIKPIPKSVRDAIDRREYLLSEANKQTGGDKEKED